jgi:hypothetical protein
VLRGDPEPVENLLELGLLVVLVAGLPIHIRTSELVVFVVDFTHSVLAA